MTLIRNSNQVKQAIDFEGFEYGKIHPSDIDCVLEFDNKHLILIEVKRINNIIPIGQRLLLERICNSWNGNSIVLKVEHTFGDIGDIPLNQCYLTEYFYNNQWKKSEKKLLSEILFILAEQWNINKLKKL